MAVCGLKETRQSWSSFIGIYMIYEGVQWRLHTGPLLSSALWTKGVFPYLVVECVCTTYAGIVHDHPQMVYLRQCLTQLGLNSKIMWLKGRSPSTNRLAVAHSLLRHTSNTYYTDPARQPPGKKLAIKILFSEIRHCTTTKTGSAEWLPWQ